jgi:hypothetical protein
MAVQIKCDMYKANRRIKVGGKRSEHIHSFWAINPFQQYEIKQSSKLKQNKTILQTKATMTTDN